MMLLSVLNNAKMGPVEVSYFLFHSLRGSVARWHKCGYGI